MGHLNSILARVGGNLNYNFQKSQMPGGLPGGGMLKLRFDRYIIHELFFNFPVTRGVRGTFTTSAIYLTTHLRNMQLFITKKA